MLALWTLNSALMERTAWLSNTQWPIHCPAGWKSWVWTLLRWSKIEPSSSIEWLDIVQQRQQECKSWCLIFMFMPFNGAWMLCSYPEASVFSCVFYREPQCFFQDSLFYPDPSMNLAFFFCFSLQKTTPAMKCTEWKGGKTIWKGHPASKIALYERKMPEHKVIFIHFLVIRIQVTGAFWWQ